MVSGDNDERALYEYHVATSVAGRSRLAALAQAKGVSTDTLLRATIRKDSR
jgi:hypothetical protein